MDHHALMLTKIAPIGQHSLRAAFVIGFRWSSSLPHFLLTLLSYVTNPVQRGHYTPGTSLPLPTLRIPPLPNNHRRNINPCHSLRVHLPLKADTPFTNHAILSPIPTKAPHLPTRDPCQLRSMRPPAMHRSISIRTGAHLAKDFTPTDVSKEEDNARAVSLHPVCVYHSQRECSSPSTKLVISQQLLSPTTSHLPHPHYIPDTPHLSHKFLHYNFYVIIYKIKFSVAIHCNLRRHLPVSTLPSSSDSFFHTFFKGPALPYYACPRIQQVPYL